LKKLDDGALKEKIEAKKFVIFDNMTNVPYLEHLPSSASGMIFGIYNGAPLGQKLLSDGFDACAFETAVKINTLLT
jgi:hypothetical protein